jgi:hypothetical protein
MAQSLQGGATENNRGMMPEVPVINATPQIEFDSLVVEPLSTKANKSLLRVVSDNQKTDP